MYVTGGSPIPAIQVEYASVLVDKRSQRIYHVAFRMEGMQPDYESVLTFDESAATVHATHTHASASSGVYCDLCKQEVSLNGSVCPGITAEVIAKLLEAADVDRPNWRVYKIVLAI